MSRTRKNSFFNRSKTRNENDENKNKEEIEKELKSKMNDLSVDQLVNLSRIEKKKSRGKKKSTSQVSVYNCIDSKMSRKFYAQKDKVFDRLTDERHFVGSKRSKENSTLKIAGTKTDKLMEIKQDYVKKYFNEKDQLKIKRKNSVKGKKKKKIVKNKKVK